MIDRSALAATIAAIRLQIGNFARRKWRRGKARARASFRSLKECLRTNTAVKSAVSLLLVALLVWSLMSNATEIAAAMLLLAGLLLWILGHRDFSTELIGIAITVLLIDRMNKRGAIEQEKKALILQMGSPDNAFAREAVRALRSYEWLYDGSLKGAKLERANLQGAILERANLQEADLYGANLQKADLAGANLREADLGDAKLQGANLTGAKLQGAGLWYADLQLVDLTGANLQGAVLQRANLRGTVLWGVDLQGADLRSADLSASAGLETVTLNGAKADLETKWPAWFRVPDTVEMED